MRQLYCRAIRDCLKTPVPRFAHSPSQGEGVAEERSDADGVVFLRYEHRESF